MIDVDCGAATSAGRVRSLNEDDYLMAPPVFVVADGMGGHAAGEVASHAAVVAFAELGQGGTVQPGDVSEALLRANERILFKSSQDSGTRGMGTTLTGLVGVEAGGLDHWIVFNVGDSRIYRYSGGVLQQLSTDHSEVQELVNSGEITAEQARRHPRRNVVTRSLGSEPAPVADQWLLPPTLGERFLLCSDGLCGELSDAEIEKVLRGGPAPQAVADELVALAVAAGGRDNVTVVVVEVTGLAESDVEGDTVPRGSAMPV